MGLSPEAIDTLLGILFLTLAVPVWIHVRRRLGLRFILDRLGLLAIGMAVIFGLLWFFLGETLLQTVRSWGLSFIGALVLVGGLSIVRGLAQGGAYSRRSGDGGASHNPGL